MPMPLSWSVPSHLLDGKACVRHNVPKSTRPRPYNVDMGIGHTNVIFQVGDIVKVDGDPKSKHFLRNGQVTNVYPGAYLGIEVTFLTLYDGLKGKQRYSNSGLRIMFRPASQEYLHQAATQGSSKMECCQIHIASTSKLYSMSGPLQTLPEVLAVLKKLGYKCDEIPRATPTRSTMHL